MTRVPSNTTAKQGAGVYENLPRHPARFTPSILEVLDRIVPDGVYLDPFAGAGGVYALTKPGKRQFIGVEIEGEWAAYNHRTVHGDFFRVAKEWLRDGQHFDGVVTSPVYGNRMSDHHNAKDASKRRGYKFDLGHDVSEGSSATMYFWQPAYKLFHAEAYRLLRLLTRVDGDMFLNVSNFIRDKKVVRAVAWHKKALDEAGWEVLRVQNVKTPRMRHGENSELRAPAEAIIWARRP